MHRLAPLSLVTSFAALVASAGCGGSQKPAPVSADFEARLKKLEEDNAKYAEALAFLQQVYDQQVAQRRAKEDLEPDPDAVFAVPVADAVAAGQVAGPASAAVTIVKAFDFACPYCADLNSTLDELVSDYNGKVRVVYENMVVHPFAMSVHLGGCAAGKQGKYLAFKKVIWEKSFPAYVSARDPGMLDEAHVLEAGKAAGLDPVRMQRDLSSEECKARVAADMRDLERFGVHATPSLFINGSVVPPMDKDGLKAVIDVKLREVASSGVAPGEYYAKEVVGKGEPKFRSKNSARK